MNDFLISIFDPHNIHVDLIGECVPISPTEPMRLCLELISAGQVEANVFKALYDACKEGKKVKLVIE